MNEETFFWPCVVFANNVDLLDKIYFSRIDVDIYHLSDLVRSFLSVITWCIWLSNIGK